MNLILCLVNAPHLAVEVLAGSASDSRAHCLPARQSLLLLLIHTPVPTANVIVQTLQLERLQALPVIGVLVSLPGVRSLLLGVLPGLALRIFVLLLPVILYALNRRAGPVGAAQLDGWVATHFFGMQVRWAGL
jgi:hypothetical protein